MTVSFSHIATRGGQLTFNFPGDLVGHIYRNGGTNQALNGWRHWKIGYQYGNNIQWHDPKFYKSGHFFYDDRWGSAPWINSSGEMHPARLNNTNYINIVRWRAPVAGKVRMLGCLFDSNLGGGNGVNMWVAKMSFKNDGIATGGTIKEWVSEPVNSRTLGTGSRTYNKSISVAAGDVFYMAVGPDSDAAYDTTVGKWTIYYETVSDWRNTSISLRHSMEDCARYTSILPNYYPARGNKLGQHSWNIANFSDRGTSHSVQITDFINSTWVPKLVRTSASHDTNIYGSAGNGTLSVDLAFGPDGAQWWGTGTSVDTTMYLYNVSPPAVVKSKIEANGWLETANQTGNKWYAGTSANPVGGGGTGRASWTRLVGGLYGVDTAMKYTINGQVVHWTLNHAMTHGESRTYVQRGLNAYAYKGWANL